MKRNKNNHAARQSKKANGERKKKGREQAAAQFHNGSYQKNQREKEKRKQHLNPRQYPALAFGRQMLSEDRLRDMFATPQEKLRDIREKLAEQRALRMGKDSDDWLDEGHP